MNQDQPSPKIVKLDNVSKIFRSNSHHTVAVQNVSMQFSRGELVMLMGPSGSGKTTLLTLIAGLIRPSTGSVHLFGQDILKFSQPELQHLRADAIGFIFQNFLLIEALTVLQNLIIVQRFAGKSNHFATQHSLNLLRKFDLIQLAQQFPSKLSQGQKQRVAIARAIANDAPLIIADEPTASLESEQGFEIIQILHELAKKRSKCVIVASHDLRIRKYADRILHINDGQIN